jgi:hypothetical protein
MFIGEATNTNFIVFGLTQSGLVSTPPDTPSGKRKPEKKKDKELIKRKYMCY